MQKEFPVFRTFLFKDKEGNSVYFTTVIVSFPQKIVVPKVKLAHPIMIIPASNIDKMFELKDNPGDVFFARAYIERWNGGKLVSRVKYDHGYIRITRAERVHLWATERARIEWGESLYDDVPKVIQGYYELPPPKELHEVFHLPLDQVPRE